MPSDHSRFAPSIPQDSLFCTLHLPTSAASSLAAATSLAAQISAFASDLLPTDWIWHRDAFELKAVAKPRPRTSSAAASHRPDEQPDDVWRLEGVMRVGDSIEDEWVGVWIIREVTRRWSGVIASVYDADGDFLLIEAAQALPPWVSPANSENRVWITSGHLHLIPLSISSPLSSRPPKHDRRTTAAGDSDDEGGPAAEGDWLSEEKALAEVSQGKWRDEKVEAVAWDRIADYPRAMQDHQHHTTMYLPIDIARALRREPSLVQKAVETFYTRDPSQLRRAAKMTRFPPADAVLTQVCMTRTAYAQLQGQEFYPSKAFGREWTDPLSAAEGQGQGQAGEKQWRERGIKVTVGFEILAGESKGRAMEHPALDSTADSASARLSALRQDKDFLVYMDNLKRAGWFPQGEMEGSEKWKAREDAAALGWIKLGKSTGDDSSRPSFSTLFQAALSRPGPMLASELAPSRPDDPDDWIAVDPAQLEDLMRERSTGKAPPASSSGAMDVDASAAERSEEARGVAELEGLAKRVNAFVDAKGEMEGAIFDDDMLSDGGDSDSDEDQARLERDLLDSDDESDGEAGGVAAMSASEREERTAALVPALADGEWGRRPTSSTIAPSAAPSPAPPTDAAAAASSVTESAASTALPISSEARSLESLDRQMKLKELRDAEARALPPVKMRRPILPRDSYDGVDSDDESDEGGDAKDGPGIEDTSALKQAMRGHAQVEDVGMDEDGDDEDEDLPQVVGDVEIDMGEEEEEFLKFARDALGLDQETWDGILAERKERGSFVPSKSKPAQPTAPAASSHAGLKSASLSSKAAKPAASKPPSEQPRVRFSDEDPTETTPMPIPADPVVPGPREQRTRPKADVPIEGRDPSLDSFEAVMKRMDEALARATGPAPTPKASSSKPPPQPRSRPPPSKSTPSSSQAKDAMDEDDPSVDELLSAMDSELHAALLSMDGSDGEDDSDGAGDLDRDSAMDYGLLKNFLDSYQAQGGMAGPVGNLLGRLGESKGKK